MGEYVKTRVQNYDGLKTKTTQSVLPDSESTKQRVWRGNVQCYQYKHCADRWLTQTEACTSGWTRNTDGELVSFVVQWTTVSRSAYETWKTKGTDHGKHRM